MHPQIRDRSACFSSSSHAIALAKKHGTRLHVLHISTKDELKLFNPGSDPLQKKITAEACVHHMFLLMKTMLNWATKSSVTRRSNRGKTAMRSDWHYKAIL
ncbi:MAG: hypothetical protein U0T81_00955 [Saprospiraceae bacterium]